MKKGKKKPVVSPAAKASKSRKTGNASSLTISYWGHVLVGAGLFLLVFILYGNSLSNQYAMDDQLVIQNLPRAAMGADGVAKVFTSNYVDDGSSAYGYRPVTSATFNFEHELHGEDPSAGHTYSLILYGINCILLYLLMVRLFRGRHWLLPVTIVVLFVAHPLHAEVVNNIKSRDELLVAFFGFSACLLFIRFADTKKWALLILAVLALAVGAFAKQSILYFLAFIPLMLYFFTEISWKRLLLYVGAAVVVLVGLAVINRLISGGLESSAVGDGRLYQFFENPFIYEGIGPFKRLSAGFALMLYNLGLFVWPDPLISYYGHSYIDVFAWGWSSLMAIAGMVIMLGSGAIALWKLPSKKPWVFALLISLIGLFMVSNVMRGLPGVVGERFMHLPSIGLCMLVGVGLFKLLQKSGEVGKTFSRKGIWAAAMALILVLCGSVILPRNKEWKDSLTLYLTDAAKAPKSAKLHALVAGTIIPAIQKGEYANNRAAMIDTAISHFEQAIEVYDGYYKMHNNLGFTVMYLKQQYSDAIPHFYNALKHKPSHVESNYNLGLCYEYVGPLDSAAKYYGLALHYDSTYYFAYKHQFQTLVKLRRYDDAIALSEMGVRVFPNPAESYVNLASVYQEIGQPQPAIDYFEKAYVVVPNSAIAQQLIYLNLQNGDTTRAGQWQAEFEQLQRMGK